MRKPKKKPFFRRYINGTKGVISLFLAIMMVPFMFIAGALINAGRINSAVAIFDEALCNASNSALGTYDSFIRTRFGLMAMSQDPASSGNAALYTEEDFINELFCYYMEQNVGSLSNTYNNMSLDATGLYPLSDTAVLRASVIQTSKVTVPAKLASDWGSLDRIMGKLTESFSLVTSIEDSLSSGMNVVTAIDALVEKQETLETQIGELNTAISNYETAHTNFEDAAKSFNTLVDNINYWIREVNRRQGIVDDLNELVADINRQIAEKTQRIEELKEDRENDHTEEINTLEDEIKVLEDEREATAPGYNEAVSNLESGKRSLTSYKNQFSSKRNTLVNKKNDYYDKIVALHKEVGENKTAAMDFQSAAKTLVEDGTELVSNMVTTGLEAGKASIDNQKKSLESENEYYSYQKTLADYGGYTEESTSYYNMIQENNSTINNLKDTERKYDNTDKVVSSAVDAANEANSDLIDFASQDLEAEYDAILTELDSLGKKVNNRAVPQGYSKITYSDCYYKVVSPLEAATITELITNLETQIEKNGGWEILQAAVGFIKALIDIDLTFNSELTSEIDTSLYSANGGLPSKIDRDQYPLDSEYDREDAEMSEEYKKLLNSYAMDPIYEVSGASMSAADRLQGHFNTLKNLIKPFKLKNLPKLWEAACGILDALMEMGAQFVKDAGTAIVQRFPIVGYISYNTANRTTFKGSAMTGEGYSLPESKETEGYCFAGAETEYIFCGSMKETTNQTAVFFTILAERALLDIAPVLADTTVQTIATTVGAATFGAGAVITYIIFIVCEAFVDTVVLANGGTIPIVKSYVYLAPSGILELLKQVCSLKLSEATKQTIYEKAGDCAQNINKKAQDTALEHGKYAGEDPIEVPTYKDYSNAQKNQSEIKGLFVFDYTKSLQLVMLLFGSSNKMIARLADIIQMESAYKSRKAKYNFNLDRSYTYLRASGQFTSDVFIKVGDDDSLTSKNRVIYNGY